MMNRPSWFSSLRIWIAGICLLPLAGCGYHLVGTTSSLPPSIKTIAIPVFQNASADPTIQNELTQAVRQSFITDGRLQVKDDKGDLTMKGSVVRYELRPVAFTRRDVASEYWIFVTVEIEVLQAGTKKPYMKKQQQTAQWEYQAPQDVNLAEQARLAGLRMVYRELGNRLVRLVIEKF